MKRFAHGALIVAVAGAGAVSAVVISAGDGSSRPASQAPRKSANVVVVPDLVGQSPESAVRLLWRTGFQLHETFTNSAVDGQVGAIFAQAPSPGSRIARGTVLSVRVSG